MNYTVRLAFLTLTLLLVACQKHELVGEDRAEPSNRAIRNGDENVSSDYAGVGALQLAGFGTICTGNLITPQVVLTAGHCVVFPDGVLAPSVLTFGWPKENLFVPVSEVVPYEGYAIDIYGTPLGADFAFLKLEQPIPLGRKSFSFWRGEFPLASGNPITIVGFGRDESDTRTSVGTQRSGTGKFDAFLSALAFLPPYYASPGSVAQGRFRVLPGASNQIACPADSGGGAFQKDGSGQVQLLGVLSTGRVTNANAPCTTMQETTYGSVAAFHRELFIDLERLAPPPGGCKMSDGLFETAQGGCQSRVSTIGPIVFSASAPNAMNWSAAGNYCKLLSEYTFGDWKLPTLSQLNVAMRNQGVTHLQVTPGALYWASNAGTGANANKAYAVTANTAGSSGLRLKTEQRKVICVRSPQ